MQKSRPTQHEEVEQKKDANFLSFFPLNGIEKAYHERNIKR